MRSASSITDQQILWGPFKVQFVLNLFGELAVNLKSNRDLTFLANDSSLSDGNARDNPFNLRLGIPRKRYTLTDGSF